MLRKSLNSRMLHCKFRDGMRRLGWGLVYVRVIVSNPDPFRFGNRWLADRHAVLPPAVDGILW